MDQEARKPGYGKPPRSCQGHLETCHSEDYQTRRMLGMGGLQGGSVPGGWHQQKWQSGPNRVLSQKVVISPWLGHLTGTPLCSAQKWGTLHVHKKWAHPSVSPGPAPDLAVLPRSAGWREAPLSPRASPVDQNIPPLLSLGEEGRQKGLFHTSLLPTIKLLKNSLRRG